MLAQLAQHMRMRRTAGGETEGEAGDGTVVLDDDCMVSEYRITFGCKYTDLD